MGGASLSLCTSLLNHVRGKVVSIQHLKATWDDLARSDPLWAVLTDPAKTDNRWDVEEFLATGVREIDAVLAYVESLGLDVPRGEALDFGCGAGRLTQALARHFGEVHGVDISTAMVETARRLNRQGERVIFHVNERPDLSFLASDTFDFVYSRITLQHMQPRYARAYIREFLRVARPGGTVVFQMPSNPLTPAGQQSPMRRVLRELLPRRALDAWREWRYNRHATMAMWWIEVDEMVHFLRRCGGRIVDIRRDDSAGEGWESFSFCVTGNCP